MRGALNLRRGTLRTSLSSRSPYPSAGGSLTSTVSPTSLPSSAFSSPGTRLPWPCRYQSGSLPTDVSRTSPASSLSVNSMATAFLSAIFMRGRGYQDSTLQCTQHVSVGVVRTDGERGPRRVHTLPGYVIRCYILAYEGGQRATHHRSQESHQGAGP